MRPTHPLAARVALCCLASAPAAEPEKDVKALREAVVKAETAKEKMYSYKTLFEKVGKAGLPELTKDEDTGIALQAAWEVHKKLVEQKEKEGGSKWVYDPDELKKFVAVLKKRTKAPVPDWWAESITIVEVKPGKRHVFPIGPDHRPKVHTTKDHTRLPEGHDLEKKADTLVYTVGKRSVEFPKDTFGGGISNAAGFVGEKRSAIVECAGGPFVIVGFEGKGGKPVWKSEGWGTGLHFLAGSLTVYVEVFENDGTVYVFGGDSTGMYLEAFDLATGKPAFRFSTSYVCLYSEAWDVK